MSIEDTKALIRRFYEEVCERYYPLDLYTVERALHTKSVECLFCPLCMLHWHAETAQRARFRTLCAKPVERQKESPV